MFRTFTVCAALLAAPAFAETVEIETAAGMVEVEQSPQSIIVFDPTSLDTLQALGVRPAASIGDALVDYINGWIVDLPDLGSMREPDYEAVAAFGADLAINGGRGQSTVPELARILPTIDMDVWGDQVGQSLARLRAFGVLFDREEEAAAVEADFMARLNAAKEAAEGRGNALIVMTNGPAVFVYGGSDGRFGWIHNDLGIPEAVEGMTADTHGEAVSFEFIRDANPDILFVIDRLAAIGEEGDNALTTLDNALVRETTAWKNDDVVVLSAAPLYIAFGGVQAMMGAFDEIAEQLAE